ncbi:hypothetical protein [Streptomyces sp. DW26H14]|uniref:hypothetical protein n=1 Tax=Streptomyces sp. DW26H14 TaxID=3435395 RepID=UPI00403DFE54
MSPPNFSLLRATINLLVAAGKRKATAFIMEKQNLHIRMIKRLAHVFDSKLMHCETCVMYVSDLCASAGLSRRAERAGVAKALVLQVAAVAATTAMTAAATAMAAAAATVMGGGSGSGDSAGGVNGGAGVLA